MSDFDLQYGAICREIISDGEWDKGQDVRPKWETDKTPAYTKSLVSTRMFFDNLHVPIATQKYVAWKTAIKEIFWIWVLKSNRISTLQSMGVNIWDNWMLPDGTIGKAYGYQLRKKVRTLDGKKVDQVDYLLHQLKHNKHSRRLVVTLWNPDDLDEMALEPCVWATQWIVRKNVLHLEVTVRSNDMALGNSFNVFQYYVLQRMIAQVSGLEVGTLQFDIKNPHIYERHIPGIQEQLTLPTYPAPEIKINPDVLNFYDFKPEDIQLIGYAPGENAGPKIYFETAE